MSSKHRSLVHELVKRSSNKDGIIEISLVDQVLTALRKTKPPRHKDILCCYLLEIRKALRFQIVEVELGSHPNESLKATLKDKMSALAPSQAIELEVSQNDSLIAGYRIRLVDDVFEDSIQSRLSKLSQTVSS